MKKILLLFIIAPLIFAPCNTENEPETPPTVVDQPPPPPPAPPPEPPPPAEEEPDEEEPEEPEELGPALVNFPAGAVYSLAHDPNVQELEHGAIGQATVLASPYLQGAGSPTFTVVEGLGGGNAIMISNREDSWQSLDLVRENFDWDPSANEYRLTVRGVIVGGGTAIIGGMDDPWNWFANVDTDEHGAFTLSALISDEAMNETGAPDQFERGFRLQSNNTSNMIIYSVTLEDYLPRAEHVIYQLSADPLVQALDVGTLGAGTVLATPILMQAGSPTFTIAEGPYGNAIRITNREDTWNALDINRQNILNFDWDTSANSYLVTVIGHVENGGTFIFGGPDDPWGWFGNVDADDDGNFSVSTVVSDATMAGTDAPEQFDRGFRLQTNNTNPLTIYDIIIERQ